MTSKISGYEGNSIFLPAAGYHRKSDASNAGTGDYYWTSSPLNPSGSYDARTCYFNGSSRNMSQNNNRCDGFSVRPVYVKE